MTPTIISPEALQRFIQSAFVSQGLPEADATQVARLMTEADLQGSDGHGVIRLPQYIKRIQAGGINKHPNIHVVRERDAMAVVDGDNGMGHLVVSRAVDIAIEKARKAGVAWVGTRYSNHAGPASLYARRPLEHNMLGLYFAVGNANHLPPWGGMDMLLSTNPIAASVPAADEPPVVLDMATTVAAYGKVKAKAKRGQPLPEGWMIDREGKPLLDPNRAGEGFLLPIGGHKGYGLALVIGLLAGTLSGAAMGRDVIDFNADHTSVTNTGQAILVIDLAAFGDPADFKRSVDRIVRDIRGSQRLPGVERIWLPGEQSHERRARYSESGIPVSAGLMAELNTLATDLGIAPLTDMALA
ncbi:Ldh family oxidoreductase [bacterium M00.F.Ca.ET.228.01.1.1]|uniref:Ldh family oxidoreductase n=2 Tax=Pseudomonadota TaxID=1224 RepID=A0AAW4TMX3_9BURK|nr:MULTISPECIES: Ldh family oxidoreductase [Burkholderia cepacia complex]TGP40196.1 Ldh family oxidoreductase [bacterium M00.F.Ca.ET.228.01.1.1]TGR96426.1 Ldh family oxidoreductase [bacterium M00.F.Ca.ET.191.01.1.1]TGT97662.1 Ldh family oxidoreductase [bacterium M00.F.Ca.ET.155.01.1.1]MBR8155476.1 Ldh family oxidoreductase [Burkholderia cenocepacia]MCA8383110.1 Ldh family oxidoreductase [Burkholderia cenocepacia]